MHRPPEAQRGTAAARCSAPKLILCIFRDARSTVHLACVGLGSRAAAPPRRKWPANPTCPQTQKHGVPRGKPRRRECSMRRYLLDGAQQAAPGPAPAAAPAAAASSGLGPAPSPAPASTQPGSGAAMGMAVSRTGVWGSHLDREVLGQAVIPAQACAPSTYDSLIAAPAAPSPCAVLYCGIGAATLVWLVALVIIVRSCMRWRRNAETNGGSQGTQGAASCRPSGRPSTPIKAMLRCVLPLQRHAVNPRLSVSRPPDLIMPTLSWHAGAAAADKPRKRVFAAPLPVLIIQPDRRSFELGFQEGEGWHSLVTQPCPAAQHDKQPGPGSSAAGTGQFVVEFAEAGVWLPADDPRGTEAAGNPSSSTHSGSDR